MPDLNQQVHTPPISYKRKHLCSYLAKYKLQLPRNRRLNHNQNLIQSSVGHQNHRHPTLLRGLMKT